MTADQPGEGMDLGALISQLGQMQQNLQAAQESAASQVVEGSAGGGAVRVRTTAALSFESVSISPEVVDPSEVEMLQDLILAALRDAVDKAGEAQRQAVGGISGLGELGGLGGLFDARGDS